MHELAYSDGGNLFFGSVSEEDKVQVLNERPKKTLKAAGIEGREKRLSNAFQ